MITGIIAEYDPFHRGHAYHAAQLSDSDCVVAVMSGCFTQRGSFARFDKRARVAAALENGVDLCIELPVPWACAAAADFAKGGVSLLMRCGCDALAFGSECGNADSLLAAAKAVREADGDAIRDGIRRGLTYPNALAEAIDAESAALLRQPNDLLATEYINAAHLLGFSPLLRPILRKGAAHDSDGECDGFASASLIRSLSERGESFSHLLPENAAFEADCPTADSEAADRTLLFLLRSLSPERIAAAESCSEGLENRILRAAAEASSFSEVAESVKSKRYTLARIRRLLLRALAEIDKDALPELPPYIRVLGLNERGAALLSKIKKTFPLLTKPADYIKLSPEGRAVFEAELRAAELYALALPAAPAGAEMRFSPVVIRG